jgi:hypothetical protein
MHVILTSSVVLSVSRACTFLMICASTFASRIFICAIALRCLCTCLLVTIVPCFFIFCFSVASSWLLWCASSAL